MIEKITIKNFRSIDNGEVVFDTPLKVLIGENGTGKTNIMLALNFISDCVKNTPVRAIQKAGGLDQVFRITKENDKKSNECSFSILFKMNQMQKKYFDFLVSPYYICYSFTLKLDNSDLSIIKESLLYGKDKNCNHILFDTSNKKFMEKEFDIEKRIYFDDEDKGSLFIHKAFELWRYKSRRLERRSKQKKDTKPQSKNKTGLETHLMGICLQTLARITGFNFKPDILRKTSDSSTSKILGYHGDNFSQVWKDLSEINSNERMIFPHFLQTNFIYMRRFYSKKMREEIMNDVKDSYRNILPFLKEIKIIEEIDSTQIKFRFKEEHLKEKDIFYGVQHLSDGSLKFLALCVAISMANYSFLHLEEIENYLHPKAIDFLFSLMREHIKEKNVQFLISTHSETVLNQCDPEEVIISKRFEQKGTKYIVPKNIQTLTKELDAGGFGLGTYWSMGGIEDE